MNQYARRGTAGLALVTAIAIGATVALAQEAAISARQAAMRQEGPSLKAILDYANNKGTDQATAIAKTQELLAFGEKLVTLWPEGTSSKDMPGKSNAKPEIWQQMDKFKALYANQKSAEQKLLEAVQKGDKAATQAVVTDIGKNCSSCHGTYRERVG